MSRFVEGLKKRELPGDATAPKNFARDFKAFKDFEPLPSVIKARKELQGFYNFLLKFFSSMIFSVDYMKRPAIGARFLLLIPPRALCSIGLLFFSPY